MGKYTNKARIRIVIIAMVAMAVVLTALHLILLFLVRNAIEDQMVYSSQGTALSIARAIEKDIERYIEFVESTNKDYNSEYYVEMNSFFTDVKSVGDLSYIFTLSPMKNYRYECIIDGVPIGSPDWIKPGECISESGGRRSTFTSAITYVHGERVSLDEHGDFVLAFAPIKNTDGEIVGRVVIAISSDNYKSSVNWIQGVLFIVYAFILFFVLLLVRRLSGNMVEAMHKDKLTGAYTKRQYESLIQTGIKEAIRNKQALNILILDLDHFKKVNDVYGHPFGDKVLSETSKAIMKSLRQGDYFIRYGGEEFIAVVKSNKGVNIVDIANRIRLAVADNTIYNKDLNNFHKVTISIGISIYDNEKKCSVSQLVSRADKALYDAKKERNKVSLYSPEMEVAESDKDDKDNKDDKGSKEEDS